MNSADYGPLSEVVTYAGYIIAASVALTLAWRGSAHWGPSPSDLSLGPTRFGALLSGIGVVCLWASFRADRGSSTLMALMVALAAVAVVLALSYLYLNSTRLRTREVVSEGGEVLTERVVAGYEMTPQAAKVVSERPDVTPQDLFRGLAYDPLKMWSEESRARMKLVFAVVELALTVTGTLALAAGAMVLSGTVGS